MFHAAGDKASEAAWSAHADELARTFVAAFWRQDHFGEYVHPERGLVDSHGLSDVNWAAVAFGVAAGRNLELLWPRLMKEPGFWRGDMPTQLVSKPFTYEKWEYNEPLPFAIGNPLARRGRDGPGLVSGGDRLPAHASRRTSGGVGAQGVPSRFERPTAIGASGIIRSPTARSFPPAHRSTANTRPFWCGWSSAIEKPFITDSIESWRDAT